MEYPREWPAMPLCGGGHADTSWILVRFLTFLHSRIRCNTPLRSAALGRLVTEIPIDCLHWAVVQKVTGLSRAQVIRLIRQYCDTDRIRSGTAAEYQPVPQGFHRGGRDHTSEDGCPARGILWPSHAVALRACLEAGRGCQFRASDDDLQRAPA